MTLANAEADRRLGDVLRLGEVLEVDAAAGRARIDLGDHQPWAMVGQLRAGDQGLWWMPAVGEQVLIAAPSGDLARAVVLCAIWAGNAPAPAGAAAVAGLNGGTMRIEGSLEVTGDVTAQGISLVNHVHAGVQPGAADTGAAK